jgi:hypothetical protein
VDTEKQQAQTVPSVEPRPEHLWLQHLIGEWTIEAESGPGQPKVTGTETVRPLGDIWVLAEGSFQVEGREPDRSLMTLGFDSEKMRFVGTWIGSMLAFLWVYEGQLSGDGTTLNLDCTGPSMRGDGRMLPYRDVIELKGEDERLLRGLVQEDDGSWRQFMVTRYKRQL